MARPDDVNGDFYKGNYVEQEFRLTTPDENTGEMRPVVADDVENLRIWVSAAHSGEPISEVLRLPASMRLGKPGNWYAGYSGEVFDPVLFPALEPLRYDKKRIWVVIRDESGLVNISVPRTAYAQRSI